MSTVSDRFSHVSGSVEPYFLKNGETISLKDSHNTVLPGSGEILARLMAGNSEYAINHILFVQNDSVDAAISSGEYYIADIFAPTVSPVGDGRFKAVFSAHTGCGTAGSAWTSDNGVSGAVLCAGAGSDPSKFVQFSEWTSNIASIPDNAYFGVFWTITFGEQPQQAQS